MKKMLSIGSLLVALLFANSCSNDFELNDTWKDIPVVYGLLSRADTATYIRVEKAFLGPNTSAFEIAQIPDSLYYENASVKLIHLQSNTEYNLTRINGNNEGYQREEGVFADSPNYLYKLKLGDMEELAAGQRYRLEINRGDELPLVTAETTVLNDLEIDSPTQGVLLDWEYDKDLDFRWKFNHNNARFFDVLILIHYKEDEGNGQVDKVAEWVIGRNISAETKTQINLEVEGQEFYKAVASGIDGSIPAVRTFKFLETVIIGGGQELEDYIDVNNVNTGITGSQVIPNYTNLSEGYGLFSSTHRVSQVNNINSMTRDSLRFGIYTEHLNFQ